MNAEQMKIATSYIELYRRAFTEENREKMDSLELQMDDQIVNHIEGILGSNCFR